MKWTQKSSLKNRITDHLAAALLLFIGPITAKIAWRRLRHVPMPKTQEALDRLGVVYLARHYYEPVVFPSDITSDLAAERKLPGIKWNAEEQLALLRRFNFGKELLAIAARPASELEYNFEQPMFGPGDAEYLYSMVRLFKPKKIIEVGCGQSTKIIRDAVKRNTIEDSDYKCDHTCIEPYEVPWLEKLGVKVIRERVERVDPEIFQELSANDILFIDSSHVIRPQGDVLFLYLDVLPKLAPGVFIHAHDICTPRDYFPEWILNYRLLWNEQYLLEAFLSFNTSFKVTGALSWLWHNQREETHRAFPILAKVPDDDPGSFWIQRVL